MTTRVVITGMGVVSPVGSNVETFWNSLAGGRSGIRRIEAFDPEPYPTKMAGSAEGFDPGDYLTPKEQRQFDRYAQFAIAAAKQAVAHAGLDVEASAERTGVYIGTGIGGIETLLRQYDQFLARGPRRVSPHMIPMMIGNMASGQVSIMTGAKGPNFAPVSACATGNHAIGEAFHLIRSGRADAMITGGAEAPIQELAFAGFCSMHAMSAYDGEPAEACRPFDRSRDGFVMGEGAGILVLESLDHATARGAAILAEIVGYGASADAHHMTAPSPDGDGAYRAMRDALADAAIAPDAVDYINAHATGTPLGDLAEAAAIRRLFGDAGRVPPVSSTKSMTGHLFGAAGAIEAIASIMAIRTGLLPPTINCSDPDPAIGFDCVPGSARNTAVGIALSNGFGFGGHNASLVFRSFG